MTPKWTGMYNLASAMLLLFLVFYAFFWMYMFHRYGNKLMRHIDDVLVNNRQSMSERKIEELVRVKDAVKNLSSGGIQNTIGTVVSSIIPFIIYFVMGVHPLRFIVYCVGLGFPFVGFHILLIYFGTVAARAKQSQRHKGSKNVASTDNQLQSSTHGDVVAKSSSQVVNVSAAYMEQ